MSKKISHISATIVSVLLIGLSAILPHVSRSASLVSKIVDCQGECELKVSGGNYVQADPNCTPCDYSQLTKLIDNGINFLFYASLLVIVYLLIFYGFKYLKARGNPGEVKGAKEALWKVVTGLLIMMLTYTVVRYFLTEILNSDFILLDKIKK